MKKKIIAIVILLFIGVNSYSQSKFDLMKIKAQAFWCQIEEDEKTVWEEKVGLFYNKKKYLTKEEIIIIQNQLITIGHNIQPNGIIDEPTVTALTNHQNYNSKKNTRKRKRQEKKKK